MYSNLFAVYICRDINNRKISMFSMTPTTATLTKRLEEKS
jgi:hypothetical protein